MKEIEVKAYVTNKEALFKTLDAIGCVFGEPITHRDTVYVKTLGPLDVFMANSHFVRIRQMNNGKTLFIVKRPVSRDVLTKMEHETEVANPVELDSALLLMEYFPSNTVVKERKISHYKDYEICIDDVKDLGLFIEVEKLSTGDHDAVRAELLDFMLSLGIKKEDEVRKGYDILMLEKIYEIHKD